MEELGICFYNATLFTSDSIRRLFGDNCVVWVFVDPGNPDEAAALPDDWAKGLGLSGAKKIEGVFHNKTTTLMVSNVHSWTPCNVLRA